jgi:excisionase family DNA binding protein
MVANRLEDDEILTVEELCKFLKLHQRTIYKLAKKGIIPGRKVGKKWLFLRSEVIKFLEETNHLANEVRSDAPISTPRKPRGGRA